MDFENYSVAQLEKMILKRWKNSPKILFISIMAIM